MLPQQAGTGCHSCALDLSFSARLIEADHVAAVGAVGQAAPHLGGALKVKKRGRRRAQLVRRAEQRQARSQQPLLAASLHMAKLEPPACSCTPLRLRALPSQLATKPLAFHTIWVQASAASGGCPPPALMWWRANANHGWLVNLLRAHCSGRHLPVGTKAPQPTEGSATGKVPPSARPGPYLRCTGSCHPPTAAGPQRTFSSQCRPPGSRHTQTRRAVQGMHECSFVSSDPQVEVGKVWREPPRGSQEARGGTRTRAGLRTATWQPRVGQGAKLCPTRCPHLQPAALGRRLSLACQVSTPGQRLGARLGPLSVVRIQHRLGKAGKRAPFKFDHKVGRHGGRRGAADRAAAVAVAAQHATQEPRRWSQKYQTAAASSPTCRSGQPPPDRSPPLPPGAVVVTAGRVASGDGAGLGLELVVGQLGKLITSPARLVMRGGVWLLHGSATKLEAELLQTRPAQHTSSKSLVGCHSCIWPTLGRWIQQADHHDESNTHKQAPFRTGPDEVWVGNLRVGSHHGLQREAARLGNGRQRVATLDGVRAVAGRPGCGGRLRRWGRGGGGLGRGGRSGGPGRFR